MTINTSAPAISARAVRKSFGEHVVLDEVDLTVAEGTIFSLLGPNGAGKTTMVRILSTLIAADAGDIRVGGHDVATRPGRGARADRRHRPVLRGGQPAHRRGEPAPDGRPAPPRPRSRTPPDRGAARAVRPHRRRAQAVVDLLRRHAAPAGPGDDAGRRPRSDLSGRAHHRTGPAQPPHHVADHPGTGHRRRDDLPHHPVPRRGRPARRPGRGAGSRPDRRRRHPRRAEAPHPRRAHPAPVRRTRRAARRGRHDPERRRRTTIS